MHSWQSEDDARKEIKEMVAEFYHLYKEDKPYTPGDRIPYARRVFDEREMQSLTDACLDFWLTSGRFTEKFEKEFAAFLNVRYAHLVNSGSSANLLAFMALTSPLLKERRIKRADEVITAACGFPTTVTPVLQFGAVPVFIDIKYPGYNIDPDLLENALSPRTKAVILAHTLGNPFNIRKVKEFCDKHGLFLIEDNCDALGSEYTLNGEKRYTGTFGDIGTSSFYPPHHMTMGEGGCVYTDDPLLNKILLSMRDWGRDCVCPSGHDGVCGKRFTGKRGELPEGYDHKYTYSHFGYNLKATDLQASIGIEQLKKLPLFTERRRHNFDYLKELLKDQEDYIILPEKEEDSDPSWFGFVITLRENLLRDQSCDKNTPGALRNRITGYLEENNIQTRLLFSGNLTKHPCFDHIRGTDAYRICGSLENTDYVMNNTFWIGVYPGMSDAEIEFMAEKIKEALHMSGLIEKNKT